jgi:hypothetical protein
MTFTAVLGAPESRPGNFEPGNAGPKQGMAALMGVAALAALGQKNLGLAATPTGVAAVTASAHSRLVIAANITGVASATPNVMARRAAAARLLGLATATATTSDADRAACMMVGGSFLRIDPNMVKLISFFSPTSPLGQPIPPPRQYQPGVPPQPSTTISSGSTNPRNTKTGGIPNEG